MTDARTVREIVSFGAVGILATATHIAIAWFMYDGVGLHGAIANLFGSIAAFFVSFLLNATATFRTTRPVASAGIRYLVVSIVSYLLCTGILLVVERLELATFLFAVAVLLVVPPTTFFLVKFWVFVPKHEKAEDGPSKVPCA